MPFYLYLNVYLNTLCVLKCNFPPKDKLTHSPTSQHRDTSMRGLVFGFSPRLCVCVCVCFSVCVLVCVCVCVCGCGVDYNRQLTKPEAIICAVPHETRMRTKSKNNFPPITLLGVNLQEMRCSNTNTKRTYFIKQAHILKSRICLVSIKLYVETCVCQGFRGFSIKVIYEVNMLMLSECLYTKKIIDLLNSFSVYSVNMKRICAILKISTWVLCNNNKNAFDNNVVIQCLLQTTLYIRDAV